MSEATTSVVEEWIKINEPIPNSEFVESTLKNTQREYKTTEVQSKEYLVESKYGQIHKQIVEKLNCSCYIRGIVLSFFFVINILFHKWYKGYKRDFFPFLVIIG